MLQTPTPAPAALTTNTTPTACPECAGTVPFTRPPMRGEVVRCPDCSAELEITNTAPITLTLAPTVEEDWGE